MAVHIAEGFDIYSALSDASYGFWDAVSTTGWVLSSTGRFTGSQSLGSQTGSTVYLAKSSGVNDATHHIAVAFMQSAGLSGTTAGLYIQFMDSATNQCCIVFRSDGAILLTSATPTGTTLATYTGAFVQNVWAHFEFEITINNTTGSIEVRKDGVTSASFSATGLNNRPGTNAYANKIQVGFNSSATPLATASSQRIDDLMWFGTSGAAPNTWVGDIRPVHLYPSADTAQKDFFKSVSSLLMQPSATVSSSISTAPGTIRCGAITAARSGVLASFQLTLNAGLTGNVNMALYDSLGAGGSPGSLLAYGTAQSNPAAGTVTFTLASSAVPIVKDTVYYVAYWNDATMTIGCQGSSPSTFYSLAATYTGTFPANLVGAVNSAPAHGCEGINVTLNNSSLLTESLADGDTTYVYSATLNAEDLYDVDNLPYTPISIVMLQGRALVKKTDAGTRSGDLQIKSSGTVVSSTLPLSSTYSWLNYNAPTDPATGVAWTLAGVNAVQLGLKVSV